jgi:hypothetical protein
VNELSPAELDLLARIDAKEELRPFFFRKAKGLKWFDALDERGYFDPAGNSAPVPAKEEGYVTVPFWAVTDYLVATSSDLLVEENHAYAERVLGIIRAVTQAAREQEFGNYRTWWQFSKIIQNVPLDLVTPEELSCVDYWLCDKYERGLVASELGEKWLVALLEQASEAAKPIALELLRVLYTACVCTRTLGGSERQEAAFRFDKWHAEKITKSVAGKSGQVLGQRAVQVFRDELQRVLEALGNDAWSSLWHPAIEDHEQNRYADDAENLLILGLRDSLNAWVREAPADSAAFVSEILEGPFCTLKRIAVHAVSKNYQQLEGLVDQIVVEAHFDGDMRHEMWHLLHDRYPLFPAPVRQRVQEIISRINEDDDQGNPHAKRTAYYQSIWLAAIRNHSEALQARYQECVALAGAEPDHPDFSSYSSGGWIGHDSPKASEELLAMGINGLVGYLQQYEDPGHFMEPGIEGLVKALKAAVKAAPLAFVPELEKFAELDCAYAYELIEAFSELWAEKKVLPWDDIWQALLNFCESVIQPEAFWLPENAVQRAHFVANRYWVVGGIGRLIEAGTKSDEHAFSPKLLDQAKGLLLILLEKESGEEFKPGSDAVSIAINSPRGRCLEALINLALRSCRLADKEGDGHVAVWNYFQPIFEEELAKPDADEYEFITLLVNYLPNFLYMSTDWVSGNLARIFDRENYQKWLCAMQAYAYVNHVYQEIYKHLKANQHFIYALDDENLKDQVSEKIIQNIVIAYLHDYENLEDDDSLIRQLLERARNEELRQLIWFIWTLRKKDDQSLYGKVLELWPRLLEAIDTDSREGRKLASRLTTWSVFITEVDDTNRDLILQVAAFAEEDYNSHDLLKSIARISAAQSQEAVAIWRVLLQGAAPDYPKEAIREAFNNFVASGDEGRRDAYSIADEYLRRGNENPTVWLREIVGRH